jgi:murein DD-endopeptidase MepM/ murein hydrolase activator NlpD
MYRPPMSYLRSMDQVLIPDFLPDSHPPYPLRVVSRSLPASRSNRLRVSWFVLGMAFGIGCATSFSPHLQNAEWVISHEKVVPALENALTLGNASEQNTPAESAGSAKLAAQERTLTDIVSASKTEPAEEKKQPERSTRNFPLSLDLKVQNGDTLISLLSDAGVSYIEAQQVVESIRPVYDLKTLGVGKNIALKLHKEPDASGNPVIASLSIPLSPTSSVELKHNRDANTERPYDVKKIDIPVEQKLVHAGGPIDSSLYDTGVKSGVPAGLLGEIITAYSYDVDFQRDIKQGDAIDVLFERLQTKDGDNVGHGNVLYAELSLGGKPLKIYRFVDKQGNADYYNEKGESLRKELLKTPINGAKITSRFGMRTHPILGYSKMHRGVDFGAPTGTPIYAAGNGTVDFVGQKGGYGNYVRIKHNNTYSTAYAHVSRFASGISPGKKVKQGQIIAYVGSTGASTGPHLHYEVLAGNEQVNPSSMKFKTGTALKGPELLAFKQSVNDINAKLAALPRATKLAMANSKDSKKID